LGHGKAAISLQLTTLRFPIAGIKPWGGVSQFKQHDRVNVSKKWHESA
jgi:hypothetical protein